MIAAIALDGVEFVGKRQRRQYGDFLRVYGGGRPSNGVHLFVHVCRELLDVLLVKLYANGVGLPENQHFHRRAHLPGL